MNISEIAQKSGVSKATVSRVLNDSPLVKPETRERIKRIIEENNYIPSAIARSLSIQNTENIGVIFPDIENPFFASALSGITSVAEKSRYNVILFNSDETEEKEARFLEVVRGKRLEGLIISPANAGSEKTAKALREFEESGIPVVLLDRRLSTGSFSLVSADNERGAYLAVEQLIREGHERIAIIEGSPHNFPVYERTGGYRKALEAYGIPLNPDYIVKADQKSDLAYEGMKRLMGLDDPPTAIFSSNNMMTLGCLQYLTEHRLQIGEDIAVIGFDDIAMLRIIDYKLSVVHRSEFEMGQTAMHILLKKLRKEVVEREEVILPVELILRGSEKLRRKRKKFKA